VQRIFAEKDFCPNFAKLAQKFVVHLLPNVFVVWPPKNGLHLFFCKPWAPFFEVKTTLRSISTQICTDFA